MRFLVTGTAGFIGFHVAKELVRAGHQVVGVDGMTPYYDVALKRRRHGLLLQSPGFSAHELMLEDIPALTGVYQNCRPDVVIHLAAQAGVRYSVENPRAYIDANVVGTFNLLELAREHQPKHLLLASTSSVYGANTKCRSRKAIAPIIRSRSTPPPRRRAKRWRTATPTCGTSRPQSSASSASTAPGAGPDMALFKFTKAISKDAPIDVYNDGDMDRDFTYVDDIAKGIILLVDVVPTAPVAHDLTEEALGLSPAAPYRVVNIGNGQPVGLLTFIEAIENSIGKRSVRNYLPMQPGDVPATFADTGLLERLTGFRPNTPVAKGVAEFVAWYRAYYGV